MTESKKEYEMGPEFWDLLENAQIERELAESVVRSDKDLTDQMDNRARHYQRQALNHAKKAWELFHQEHELPSYTETGDIYRACHITRKVKLTRA